MKTCGREWNSLTRLKFFEDCKVLPPPPNYWHRRISYIIKRFLVNLACVFVPPPKYRDSIRCRFGFAPHYRLKKDLYKTHLGKTSFGDYLEIFEGDYITKRIFLDGLYELDELTILDSLFSLMPSRKAALDVGGNIGNHCALFSRCFQETHAIEPHFEVFQVLARNIERNGWKAKAYNVGFSDHDGLMKLFINHENDHFGMTSFVNRTDRGVDVAVTTGDVFVQKNISEPVDFMKIDVESYEGPVITGLAETIKKYQPIISMEWNNQTTVTYFLENNLFATVLEGYHQLAMYPRWRRNRWLGIFGQIRRGINRIYAKRGHGFYLSSFAINKESPAVILIPPKHEALIAPLKAAFPLVAI